MNISILSPAFSIASLRNNLKEEECKTPFAVFNPTDSIVVDDSWKSNSLVTTNDKKVTPRRRRASSPEKRNQQVEKGNTLFSTLAIRRRRRSNGTILEERAKKGANTTKLDQSTDWEAVEYKEEKLSPTPKDQLQVRTKKRASTSNPNSPTQTSNPTTPKRRASCVEIPINRVREECSRTLGLAVEDLELYTLQMIPISAQKTMIHKDASLNESVHLGISVRGSSMSLSTIENLILGKDIAEHQIQIYQKQINNQSRELEILKNKFQTLIGEVTSLRTRLEHSNLLRQQSEKSARNMHERFEYLIQDFFSESGPEKNP